MQPDTPQIEFSRDGYRALLGAAADSGYRFAAFDDADRFDSGRVCLLRHDIDADLERALELALIEQSMGVRSTFLLMIRSPIYNLFARANDAMVREIIALGHWIGLHHDADFAERSGLDLAASVALEARFLSEMFDVEVNVVSFHQPSDELLERDIVFDGLVNTYGESELRGFEYLADSNREWRADPLQVLADPGRSKLQLLIHPMWWGAATPEMSSEQTWNEVLRAKFELMQDQLCETERGYGARRMLQISGGGE
jgi:hypothetical protein